MTHGEQGHLIKNSKICKMWTISPIKMLLCYGLRLSKSTLLTFTLFHTAIKFVYFLKLVCGFAINVCAHTPCEYPCCIMLPCLMKSKLCLNWSKVYSVRHNDYFALGDSMTLNPRISVIGTFWFTFVPCYFNKWWSQNKCVWVTQPLFIPLLHFSL